MNATTCIQYVAISAALLTSMVDTSLLHAEGRDEADRFEVAATSNRVLVPLPKEADK